MEVLILLPLAEAPFAGLVPRLRTFLLLFRRLFGLISRLPHVCSLHL